MNHNFYEGNCFGNAQMWPRPLRKKNTKRQMATIRMQFNKTIVYLVFGGSYRLLRLESFHIAAMNAEYAARQFSTCHFLSEAFMIYVRVISVCFSISETIYFTQCVTSAQICDAI